MHRTRTPQAAAVGRHRRTPGPGRHRAETPTPIHTRAGLIATTTLTGATVVTAIAAADIFPAHSTARAASPVAARTTTTAPASAPASAVADTVTGFGGTPVGVAVRRLPTPTPTAAWVDPMPAGTVTSCFGPRWGRQHAGVDLAAAAGTTVAAAATGTVASAGTDYDGYGISVLIEHPDGVSTHYAHLASTAVRPGDTVTAGQPIGAEGSTGNSTGPHLHFEVRQGGWDNTVEPTAWMRQKGVDLGCAS
ncbi:M23 family metallopeptidase [Actinoplanes sp. NPDC051346]|uniref:M23 family metallopeptidase n=1 Tax=Actinoplanes sp. NPDC051346 TaxID=3155048 RepID=UPI003449214E